MHEETESAYLAAWCAAEGAENRPPLVTSQQEEGFQKFLASEEVEIDHEVALMMNQGLIIEEQVDRWRDRVALVRAVRYMMAAWVGVCHVCEEDFDGDESGNETRTICRSCADGQKPVPTPGELFDLLNDIFPTNIIKASTAQGWNEGSCRIIGNWLDLVLAGKAKTGEEPALLKSLGNIFGPSTYGAFFLPEVVEIGTGGTIPDSGNAHTVADPNALPAKSDAAKGGAVEEL